jgi:CheY-like chemotaxis protein
MTKLSQVVLIDDDDTNNYMNRILILELDITDQIVVSQHGHEALAYLQELPTCPPLVFLDINMPSMDGFEFLEALNQLNLPGQQEMVIVVLTTSRNPMDIRRLNHLGKFEYICKPLTDEKLIPILQTYFPALADTHTDRDVH